MRCPKIIRWLCGAREQKRHVRLKTVEFNDKREASLAATDRLRRESIKSALFPDQSAGESP